MVAESCFVRVVREDDIPQEMILEQRLNAVRVSHAEIFGGRDFNTEEGMLQGDSEVTFAGQLKARAAMEKGKG